MSTTYGRRDARLRRIARDGETVPQLLARLVSDTADFIAEQYPDTPEGKARAAALVAEFRAAAERVELLVRIQRERAELVLEKRGEPVRFTRRRRRAGEDELPPPPTMGSGSLADLFGGITDKGGF